MQFEEKGRTWRTEGVISGVLSSVKINCFGQLNSHLRSAVTLEDICKSSNARSVIFFSSVSHCVLLLLFKRHHMAHKITNNFKYLLISKKLTEMLKGELKFFRYVRECDELNLKILGKAF